MRVIVFGTGQRYQNNKGKLEAVVVVAFADNAEEKQGRIFEGSMVISPAEIKNYDYDRIVIACKAVNEITDQLIGLGIGSDQICDITDSSFFDNAIEKREVIICRDRWRTSKGNQRVLLFSHDLSRTGAPMALYYLARIIVKNGFSVSLYFTGLDQMLSEYVELGIPVSRFVNFYLTDEEIIEIGTDYDLVICNTTVLFPIVKMIDEHSIPCIWWVHELATGYPFVPSDFKLSGKTRILAVADGAKEDIEKYMSGQCDILHYMIPEHSIIQKQWKDIDDEKIIFLMVGISLRKGIELLESCLVINEGKWRGKAWFCLIGDTEIELNDSLKDKTDYVGLLGNIRQDTVLDLYDKADAILCPSIIDTLPMSVTQSWMMKKCTIVSDAVGSSNMIKNYYDGIIFKSQDVGELALSIQWVIDNREEANEIGKRSYKLYNDHFSEDIFEKELVGHVNAVIKETYAN